MARLSREFYLGDTVEIAQALLGKYLVRRLGGETLAGRITETEAYVGRCDKACHAYNYRRTSRTSTLFAPPGTAYVYLIYGMYHCLNFVTEPEGEPAAVLLRGDDQSRAAFLSTMIEHGILNPDEARALEERAPIPGGWGQTFFITKNLGSMESVAKDTE